MKTKLWSKDDVERRAYLYLREKKLEYVDNAGELIELCRDFAYPIISYFNKENKALKKQMEQMKVCENCKHYNAGYLECMCKKDTLSCKRVGGKKDLWELKKDD